MDILAIIEKTGHSYKKMASTGGGEYKGPCPWCGGDDRFSIQPKRDHFVCRRCKRAGDSITFYRDFHGMKYYEACAAVGKEPVFQARFLSDTFEKEVAWEPRVVSDPCGIWQEKAEAVAFSAHKFLMSIQGKPHREYLHSRGISLATIRRARLGWVNSNLSFDRGTWGLSNLGGREKPIWVPRGILVPFFEPETGKLIRLRIRQDKPISGDRYILVAGSSTRYFTYPDLSETKNQSNADPTKNSFLVESELDGWLCWQNFGDLSQIYAIGNSTARPDSQTALKMKNTAFYLCLDNDEAGRDEIKWWQKQYPDVSVCTVPVGKDPGELFEMGVDLRKWVKKFLLADKPMQESTQKPDSNHTETVFFEPKHPNTTQPANPSEIESKSKTRQSDFVDPVKKETKPSKMCFVGTCLYAKNGECAVAKKWISCLDECPKEFWYRRNVNGIDFVVDGVKLKRKN